jgi:hypothetical protein
VTTHEGGTIQFRDISVQLLKEIPLSNHYPRLLSGLTIDVGLTLIEPSVPKLSTTFLSGKVTVAAALLCSEASQCVVTLESGHLLLYKFASDSAADAPRGNTYNGPDKEITVFTRLGSLKGGSGWYPEFMLSTNRGPISAFSMSDYGELAACN